MNAVFKTYTYRCDEDAKTRFDIALKRMGRKTASEEIRLAIERFVQAVEAGEPNPQLEIALAIRNE